MPLIKGATATRVETGLNAVAKLTAQHIPPFTGQLTGNGASCRAIRSERLGEWKCMLTTKQADGSEKPELWLISIERGGVFSGNLVRGGSILFGCCV